MAPSTFLFEQAGSVAVELMEQSTLVHGAGKEGARANSRQHEKGAPEGAPSFADQAHHLTARFLPAA